MEIIELQKGDEMIPAKFMLVLVFLSMLSGIGAYTLAQMCGVISISMPYSWDNNDYSYQPGVRGKK